MQTIISKGILLLASIFEGPSGSTTPTQAGLGEVDQALQGSGLPETDQGLLGNIGVFTLKFVNFLLPYLALAAFVGYVYAGILYVANFGNDEMLDKSKKILIYSTAGLILVILSYTIVRFFTVDLTGGLSG